MKKNTQGFILLEAILAVSMLGTIFAAAISLYSESVSGLRMTNDQLVATYLAQDGAEQVIAKRQYNFDTGEDWLHGITCPSAAPCAVDYFVDTITTDLIACTDLADGCQLFTDADGVFSHDPSGTLSYFSRTVEVTESGAEARVVVTVSWDDSGKTFSVPISYVLYDNPNNSM